LDILQSYFSEPALEALKWIDFDASAYGKGKGLKQDMLPHPHSGLAPFFLLLGSSLFRFLLTRYLVIPVSKTGASSFTEVKIKLQNCLRILVNTDTDSLVNSPVR
jgi:hypothetical protein